MGILTVKKNNNILDLYTYILGTDILLHDITMSIDQLKDFIVATVVGIVRIFCHLCAV